MRVESLTKSQTRADSVYSIGRINPKIIPELASAQDERSAKLETPNGGPTQPLAIFGYDIRPGQSDRVATAMRVYRRAMSIHRVNEGAREQVRG